MNPAISKPVTKFWLSNVLYETVSHYRSIIFLIVSSFIISTRPSYRNSFGHLIMKDRIDHNLLLGDVLADSHNTD